MQVLKAVNLVKKYKERVVVNKINLEVKNGEIVGLLGPNGAGKTTTFYMVVGVTVPEAGSIVLNDKDITHIPMYERSKLGISYLPQEPSVFRGLSVEDNIMAILENQPISKRERLDKRESLLEELGVKHIRKIKAHSLSGGERRRVEITRALAASPIFILLDEPFSGIDPIALADIQAIIAHLQKKGIGMLITDHNVRETLQITDRAYIINEGAIIDDGTPEKIARSEKARKIYLGEKFTLCP